VTVVVSPAKLLGNHDVVAVPDDPEVVELGVSVLVNPDVGYVPLVKLNTIGTPL